MSNRLRNMPKKREDAQDALDGLEVWPQNRKTRRRIVKLAGKSDSLISQTETFAARWHRINPTLKVKPPLFLGIRRYKKSARGRSLIHVYKENAWRSWFELLRRRTEINLKPKKRGSLKDLMRHATQ